MSGWAAGIYLGIGLLTNLLVVVPAIQRDPRFEADWSDWILALNLVTALLWPLILVEELSEWLENRRPAEEAPAREEAS